MRFDSYAIRVALGSDPPPTALTEVYKVPPPGYGIRGADVDGEGVFWAALGSGHLASFDRRKCKGPLNGDDAEKGEKCPEGWSFYPLPGFVVSQNAQILQRPPTASKHENQRKNMSRGLVSRRAAGTRQLMINQLAHAHRP